jgi:hypothetical protein
MADLLLRVLRRLLIVYRTGIIFRVPPTLGRAAHGTMGIRFGGQLDVLPLPERRRDMPAGVPVPTASGRFDCDYFRRP